MLKKSQTHLLLFIVELLFRSRNMDFNLKKSLGFVIISMIFSLEVKFDYTMLPRLSSVPKDFKAVFLHVHCWHKTCLEQDLCFLYAAVHTLPHCSKIKTVSNVLHALMHVQTSAQLSANTSIIRTTRLKILPSVENGLGLTIVVFSCTKRLFKKCYTVVGQQ